MAEKPHMNLAVIGHVDHGKSTLVGRLLFETGVIKPHIIEEFKKQAEEKGKGTFEFAWVMDNLKEERERGLTIDVAHRRFDTKNYYFTIVDCPGHRDFIKNMITGASQADAAVLVVDVKDRAENNELMPQTKEHAILSWTLGINQLIVVINKMDAVGYKKEKYEETKGLVATMLKKLGFKLDTVTFMPISGFKGDNVANRGENLSWFDGPTLLETLDNLKQPEKPTKLPLRIPVQDVYTITGVGTVPVGRVETGTIKKGDKVIFNPEGNVGEVKSIEMHHEEVEKAIPGDNIGWNVRGIGKNDIRRGDVCGPADNPPTVVDEFTAQVIVLQHPGVITVGYTPVFHCHTAQVACMITELKKKLDPASGGVKEENPDFIKTGDAAIVQIKPTRPMVIEKFKEIPQLGRFAIRDMGTTIAAGMVIDVKKK